MRSLVAALFVVLALPVTGVGQSACPGKLLPEAAKAVAALRSELHAQGVKENDPNISATVATQLNQWKNALAKVAEAAFACANPEAKPEEIEQILANALHANLSASADTVIEARGKQDLGVYGSDLTVQVFPLYSSPKYYEVNFRYGLECGDDNLLLIFAATPNSNTPNANAWHQVLRWDAPGYHNVSDAFGDFVLLTPLSGFPGQRNWRFVVAHGRPGCGPADSPSRFALDILEPSADPAHPEVVWHLEHAYPRNAVPRLSTTEDTLTFELNPPEKTTKAAQNAAHPEVYRYHIGKDNHVEPLTASGATAPPPPNPVASTHSPQ